MLVHYLSAHLCAHIITLHFSRTNISCVLCHSRPLKELVFTLSSWPFTWGVCGWMGVSGWSLDEALIKVMRGQCVFDVSVMWILHSALQEKAVRGPRQAELHGVSLHVCMSSLYVSMKLYWCILNCLFFSALCLWTLTIRCDTLNRCKSDDWWHKACPCHRHRADRRPPGSCSSRNNTEASLRQLDWPLVVNSRSASCSLQAAAAPWLGWIHTALKISGDDLCPWVAR